jgi:lipopolysaccharide/colanic/teichoic acid biosynthesis glycosyltransferase
MPMSSRLLDVLGAAGGLVVFSPVMAAIAAAVWCEDRQPVLFRQERVGLDRRPFTILKFRSMRDGRVTGVGRVLRATGLDELPQFVNILRGEMSAVGPRPLTAHDVQRLGWATPDFDFRWRSRPGLTGLAQLVGARPATSALDLDRTYLERRSLLLDCQLIAFSFVVNAVGKARVQALLSRTRLVPDPSASAPRIQL